MPGRYSQKYIEFRGEKIINFLKNQDTGELLTKIKITTYLFWSINIEWKNIHLVEYFKVVRIEEREKY